MEEPFLIRLKEEKAQLSERLEKLNNFLTKINKDDDSVKEITPRMDALMITQSIVMKAYFDCLDARITLIEESKKE